MNPLTLPPSTGGTRHPPRGPVRAVQAALTSHSAHFQDSRTKGPRSTCRTHIRGAALVIAGEVYGWPAAAGAASATSRCRAGGETPLRLEGAPMQRRAPRRAAAATRRCREANTAPWGRSPRRGTAAPRRVPAPADGGGRSAQSGVGPREPRSAAPPAPPPAFPHGSGRRSRPSAAGRPVPDGGRCPAFPPHALLGPAPSRCLPRRWPRGSGCPQGVHMGAAPRQPSPLPAPARPHAAPRSREVSAGARCGCGRLAVRRLLTAASRSGAPRVPCGVAARCPPTSSKGRGAVWAAFGRETPCCHLPTVAAPPPHGDAPDRRSHVPSSARHRAGSAAPAAHVCWHAWARSRSPSQAARRARRAQPGPGAMRGAAELGEEVAMPEIRADEVSLASYPRTSLRPVPASHSCHRSVAAAALC